MATPIWAVVVDGVPYVRSGYGERAQWYRRVQETGRAVFADGPRRYPVRVENVSGTGVNCLVDEAYRAKYARYGQSVEEMTAPTARETTMRLVPE
ncbi:hypothetical protein BJF78_28040 [Pseudonocardia sp. CNS-139]|nr:hypothetical protein BJF78_28040 [Pseudonocardia sp. CNS-139]